MPDLFPTSLTESTISDATTSRVTFGDSFKFDFNAGEFVLTPTGKNAQTKNIDAWVEWCQKALMTARYRYLVYTRNYGQEFEDAIGQNYTKPAAESEIRRMAIECLTADPRTARVDNFVFTWLDASSVMFSCDIYNVLDESANITGSVVISQ